MIQNTPTIRTRVATYVYLRNGIYYFQLRLKKYDERQGRFKSGLIRKSLKTGNYREAIMRARLLWLKYMTNKKTPEEVQDEIDASAQKQADIFTRGKELYDCFQKLNPDDNNSLDWFFSEKIGELGNITYDQEAFQSYREYIEKNKPIKTVQVVTQPTSVLQPNKPRVRISEMVKRFIDDNQASASPWDYSQLGKYNAELSMFCQLMGDCYIDELTTENIRRQYVESLHLLPLNPKRHKVLCDKKGELLPAPQIISLAKKHQLETVGVRTYKSKAILVKTFLKQLAHDEYTEEKLKNAFSGLEKIETPERQRPILLDEDLQAIFNCNEFYKGIWFKKYVFRHWVTLIALYSGMRVNEICQLEISDIKQDKKSKIFYFDLNKNGDRKSLKNTRAKRKIPIHQTLIKLGFLSYVESQKRKKETKLFSELTYTKGEKWSKKVKRWFNHDYLEVKGVEKFVSEDHTTVSFHCFRTTFNNYIKQNGLDRSIGEEILGHTNKKVSSVNEGYTLEYTIERRKEVIDKIKYNIDVEKIKKWS